MLLNLNTLVAWTCVLQWWIETELCFFKRSRYEDDSSSFAILNARSCKQLIFFVRPLLWNIQTMPKSAYFKCFHNFFFKSCSHTLHFWLSFFTEIDWWSSEESFESESIPSSSFLFSDMMVLLSIDISTYNVVSWEKYMSFAIIDFQVVKVKPVKQNSE